MPQIGPPTLWPMLQVQQSREWHHPSGYHGRSRHNSGILRKWLCGCKFILVFFTNRKRTMTRLAKTVPDEEHLLGSSRVI